MFLRKLLIAILLVSGGVYAQQSNALKYLSQMFDSIKNIRTVRYHIKAMERVEGKFMMAASEVKILTSPRNLYFYNRQKKLEILYVNGNNNNKAYVKPHVFPYLTISLSPTSNLMRKNQHYTINDLGFDFIARIMGLTLSKEKDISKSLTYLGKHDVNGKICYLLVYENANFGYYEYTVQSKETVSAISGKLLVNDFMVRTKNNLYNEYGYLKAGSKLMIPDLYCKKAVIYLDEKTMLPVNINLFDDVGLFESYEFSKIVVNPKFEANEFTKGFKDYHF